MFCIKKEDLPDMLSEMWTQLQCRRPTEAWRFIKKSGSREVSPICWLVDIGRQAKRRNRDPDKLSPIRAFFELWLPTLQDSYIPYENLTVDEQLLTFRGRCPFKQFIPSKPGKYGIKIWAACDSQTSFVYKCQRYIGKTGDQRERNRGKRVVLDMTKGLETSGRNVTTDNFFTSLDLARKMEKKNLTLLGTIRKNKPKLSQELVTTRGRDVYSTKIWLSRQSHVSLLLFKKGKVVTLLSTMHDSGQISETEKKKPQMILDYNKTKSAWTSQNQPQETQKLKRCRCWKGPRNLDRKYSKRCQNCNPFVCNVHQKLPAINVNLTTRNPVTIL
ncbi:hypothetical protein ILUMI_00079 [Ignelater luminosus]|uniref:PiggyBac transposable element-derived protein domain-containing protein n=1 Tax=Ignelater luminosus TaxID=2038154 RepID=A0A8K0DMJ0_IGNLU|nr:hypothetical protein ILUMI_00079 [Ignelater luminosus]